MKAQLNPKKARNGGKSQSRKPIASQTKSARAKRVQPLVPKQFVHIIENISDGVVVLDKDWHYVFVNQKAAVMLQRKSPSDLIGKHIWTEYPEGIGQPFQIAYEKSMREQIPVIFEDHYEPWDLWFENRIYPSPDGILILFTEITDKKRTEALLKERQYLLQKILDTEPGTVYIYDLEERRNVYVNRNWLSEYGYTPEETQAMGDELLARIFHPDELEQISAHHENWKQAGEGDTREIEYRILAKTGEWHWVHSHEAPFMFDESGRVKQILGISYEVTPRREAQEALRRSEQELGLIYDTISDITFLLSIEPEGRYRFISVNKAFLQTTGLNSKQVLDRYADEIIPSASQELVFGNYTKAVHQKAPVTWEEVSQYPAGEKTAIVTVNPVYNEAGDCTHLVGAIHDITEHKKTEEAIREQNRFISALAETTPGLVYVYDWETGSNVYSNRGYEVLLGYTSREVKDMGTKLFAQLIHPDDVAAVDASQERLASASDKDMLEIDYRMRHSNGEWRWLRSYERPFAYDKDGSLKQKIGIAIDITERKQAEKALRESEEKFSKVFHASPVPLSITRISDGHYIEVNDSFLNRLGYRREEVIGRTALEVGMWVDPDDREKMTRLMSEKKSVRNFETRFLTKYGEKGTTLLFRDVIQLAGDEYFIGTSLDITDRKQMEEVVLKERDFSDAMLNSLPGILYFFDQSGKFLRWNRNFETITGYSAEEISRSHPLDFFSAEEKEYIAGRIQTVFETGESDAEANLLLKTGEEIPYYFTGRRIEMDGTSYLIGMGIDISQRKLVENEIRKLNLELEERISARTEELAAAMIKAQESDRLKSAFLAAMSHELRTPLNSIIGFNGVILQGLAGPLNEEQTKQLNMMRDSARHLLALINDVLDISKIEAGQLVIVKRPFDMRQAIESALRVVFPLAQKKALPLETSIGPGVGVIDNDRRRVEQVLINLINNAIKFTEHGQIQISCQLRENCLETSVRDSGIGIKPEDMEKLFKPFQQLDTGLARGHEGTGLGLAICERLVTAMGGEISMESQWGIGSTFKFTLPL